MIYTDSQLKEKIVRMIESFENEVVEFKEARTNYSFNDIGKYFSALSNEANLRGLQEAWLIFGISDDKRYVGTEFRKQGSLQSLKKEIVNGTNERLTFLEIYELTMEKCRVIAFQIPPAIRGIPTTWQGAAYAREHESVSPLPMNKVDLLRNQIGMDWSKEIVEDATIEDWKKKRFESIAPEWMTEKDAFFNRWFNSDKSVNIRILKKSYPEHVDEIVSIDKKDYKKYVKDVIEPIDDLFLDMSNKVIELTSGLINDGVKDKAIINLKNEIESTKKLVDEKGTQEDKDKLRDQLLRLQKLGNKLNSTEGIVFTWKDRMMKMTGSFAAANAIIGAKYRIK